MDKIKRIVKKLYANGIVRYIFFGGCTTLVNLVSFYLLRNMAGMPLTPANFLSIVLAILFAYVVNSKFVFRDRCEHLRDHLRPFCKFIGARLLSMVVELGGVWLLVEQMEMWDMLGKFLTQFIVLILNYLFSKFFVFTTGKKKSGGDKKKKKSGIQIS